jgi:hypothetical protein
MGDKPSYLGLLNFIANAEGGAECYLNAWAAVTPRDDVRQILATVALREGEHSKAFAKRMCELGYAVQPRIDPKFDEKMAIAASTELTDLEKLEKLEPPADRSKPDVFAGMFNDSSIDIQTGALLGRYIAEERDTIRMLDACRMQLRTECEVAASSNGSANGSVAASTEARLARVEHLLEQLLAKLPG